MRSAICVTPVASYTLRQRKKTTQKEWASVWRCYNSKRLYWFFPPSSGVMTEEVTAWSSPHIVSPEASSNALTSSVLLHLHTDTLCILTHTPLLFTHLLRHCTPPDLTWNLPSLASLLRQPLALRSAFHCGLRHVRRPGLDAHRIIAPIFHQLLLRCARWERVALVRRLRQRQPRDAHSRCRCPWPGRSLSTLHGWGVSHYYRASIVSWLLTC